MPGPIQDAARRHPVLSSLHVTDAGFFPDAVAHGIERKRGAAGAVLIVCLAGKGWARIGATASDVRAGQTILIAPDQPHSYGADPSDAWTIVWAHFRGEELAFWWRLLALPKEGSIIQVRCRTPEQLELGRVHEQLAAGYDEPRQIAAAAALRWSLAQLSGAGESSGERDDIEAVATWMREHVGQTRERHGPCAPGGAFARALLPLLQTAHRICAHRLFPPPQGPPGLRNTGWNDLGSRPDRAGSRLRRCLLFFPVVPIHHGLLSKGIPK